MVSKFTIRIIVGILLLSIVLYAATLVVANTSLTQTDIHSEIVINASASTVWQVLLDFDAYPQWNPFIENLTGNAIPGEQLTAQIKAGDLTMIIQPTVLVVEPERELRWRGHLFIPGIFDGEHSFTIEPVSKDQVRFIQREDFNGLLIPFSNSLLEDTQRGFKEMNQALKERVEQEY